MVKVVFESPQGESFVVEAQAGQSVMQVATAAMVPGISSDCGGAGICATCHGYVDPAWTDRLPAPGAEEVEMIDAGCLGATEQSRLTCQIILEDGMDGLVIQIPADQ